MHNKQIKYKHNLIVFKNYIQFNMYIISVTITVILAINISNNSKLLLLIIPILNSNRIYYNIIISIVYIKINKLY